MKKTFIIFLFALLFNLNGQGQSCLPNGINFTSQAEIDNFPTNYPGCTVIEGNVSTDSSGIFITDLNGLSGVTVIQGGLSIYGTNWLTNLNGLDNLTTVGGDLSIDVNSELTSLSGLDNLTSVGGDLAIYGPSLSSLSGLDNLNSIGGDLLLGYVPGNWNGLSNLNSVGGNLSLYTPGNWIGLGNLLTIGGDLKVHYINGSLSGFEKLTSIGGTFSSSTSYDLTSMSGLDSLAYVGGDFTIYYNAALTSIGGLGNLKTIGGDFYVDANPQITDLSIGNLHTIGGDFIIWNNPLLKSLNSLGHLDTVSGNVLIGNNLALTNLNGYENLHWVGGEIRIEYNAALSSLSGLEGLTSCMGNIKIESNPSLKSLKGLDSLTNIGGNLLIRSNDSLSSLSGLDKLTSIGGELQLWYNDLSTLIGLDNLTTIGGDISCTGGLTDCHGLEKLSSLGGSLGLGTNMSSYHGLENLTYVGGSIGACTYCGDMSGLDNLAAVGGGLYFGGFSYLGSLYGLDKLKSVGGNILIYDNYGLLNMNGLGNLTSVGGYVKIEQTHAMTTLSGLDKLSSIGGYLLVDGNPVLSDCSAFAVCNQLLNNPEFISIYDNAPGCENLEEVKTIGCGHIPVLAEVRLDNNGDCLPDTSDTPAAGVQVRLSGSVQMSLRPTGFDGLTLFGYLDQGDFSLGLPQFPNTNWAACQNPISITPGATQDTIKKTFLLKALTQCPELTITLGLPSFFRGCLRNSDMNVSVQNTGTVLVEGAKVALIMPSVLELVASTPLFSVQSGDTLYFELGDIKPFETAVVHLTVKTKCDTFLIGQTLCIETFAALDNACPNTLPAFSEIKLSAKCIGDTIVRFTIKNIGDAPTQTQHGYKIIRNEIAGAAVNFSLNAQQNLVVDVPANGATYRMEATKFDDGTLTATALENCAGLMPGQITAFWFDKGGLEYDFDCRQVIGSFDPNLKTAVPTGAGTQHILAANRALHYTIDFQNTGSDMAYHVLLRDVLDKNLDINTFRPGFASHPYTWDIRDMNKLNVLFSMIMLPDSNTNEPASHGFFSFDIEQKSDLPDGTTLNNTANIIFDFNPPITTNTVQHTIGQLTVRVVTTKTPRLVAGARQPDPRDGYFFGKRICSRRETVPTV